MSLRQTLVLLVAISALSFLIACGGNGATITKPVASASGAFNNSNFNGTYVFSVSGIDSAGAAFAMVGTLTANGGGAITGGTLDINSQDFNTPLANATIGSSSYNVTVDGRGTANISTSPANPFGKIGFDFVLTSSAHGLITQFDGNATGSGTLDLQTAGATPTGAYAFSFSGADANGAAFVTVGNFTLGAGGAITGIEDLNDNVVAHTSQTLSGSLVLGPSSTPATQLTTSSGFGTQTFDVFAIDATHLKFIEMDAPLSPILSGDAFSQPTTTISAGAMAFTLAGFISSAPAAIGGFLVADGAGNLTTASTEDVNSNGSASSAPVSFSASYAVTTPGRYVLSNFVGLVALNSNSSFVAYPSSGGLLLLEIDNIDILAGAAFPQSSTTFNASQGYALNLTGINLGAATGSPEEVDDIAEFSANSSGATAIGLIDENFAPAGAPTFDQALNGNYQAPDANGRGLLSATAGNNSNTTLNGGFNLTFYTVDGVTFPFIESDSGQVATGVFVQQNPAAAAAAAATQSHVFTVRPLIRPHFAHQQKN